MISPDLSSFTVKQIVSDCYHKALYSIYGEKYLTYRELWDNVIAGKQKVTHPLHIDFELLNACNYKCSFCPYSVTPKERPKGFDVNGKKLLDIDLIEKVLKEAKGRLYAVELGYNTEPLLNKKIIEIIKMCKEHNVLDIRMSTNGSLLSQYDYVELIRSGITQLQVSIDAVDDQSYRKARQSKLYDLVTKSLKDLIKTRDMMNSLLPRIKVSYVMTNENKDKAQIFQNQWNNIADIIALQDLIVYPDSTLDLDTKGLSTTKLDEYPGCYMPKVRMSIRSDGTVQPCCTVPGMKLRIGNIAVDSVESLWNSSSMEKIRESHFNGSWKKNKVCLDCVKNTVK